MHNYFTHSKISKGSPLCNVWRQHCDSVGKPVVIMMKASGRAGGGRTEVGADSVVVDWSTLRDPSNEDTRKQIDIDVAKAAADNNMELKELDEEEEVRRCLVPLHYRYFILTSPLPPLSYPTLPSTIQCSNGTQIRSGSCPP